jgi:hypothetical protein
MSFAPKGSAPKLSGGGGNLCKRCGVGEAARKCKLDSGDWAPVCEPCGTALDAARPQPAPGSAAPGAPAASPKPATSDAAMRKPTNYLVGAYDSRVLQDACNAMQGAESEASRLAQAHLDCVLQVGAAASAAVADSATASQVTTAALAALAAQTEALKLGFDNGAGCCG